MQSDHLNSNEDDGLMSIEDFRALCLRKKKIESDKKAKKYIMEINQRYRKMSIPKSHNFLRNMNPFKKAAQIFNLNFFYLLKFASFRVGS
tara:strand:- start:363 stop:632 length:270 start_codon:yes stop_codon:yes gene_type:complete